MCWMVPVPPMPVLAQPERWAAGHQCTKQPTCVLYCQHMICLSAAQAKMKQDPQGGFHADVL